MIATNTNETGVHLLTGKVIQCCPKCSSSNVFCFEGEAFCLYCNWESINEQAQFLGLATLFNDSIKTKN